MDNNSFETSFEKGVNFGGNTVSIAANASPDAWSTAMSDAGEGPSYFGKTNESAGGETDAPNAEASNEYDQTISDGAAILNYGLNGASAMLGVDAVINGIKNFNVANSDRPIHDLYVSLGIDTKEEFSDLRQNQDATKNTQNAAYSSENAPATLRRSPEGARKAIQDMQELIRAVEKDDEDYADLREAAKKNNKSVFEQAIIESKYQDLASVFGALTTIKQSKSQQDIQQDTRQNSQESDPESVQPLEEDIKENDGLGAETIEDMTQNFR